jgi:hypothetical protein
MSVARSITDDLYSGTAGGFSHPASACLTDAAFPPVPARYVKPVKARTRTIDKISFLGVEIEYERDGKRPFPPAVAAAMERISEFTVLQENWDGYGSAPLNQGAVRVALQAIFLANRFGNEPSVVPLTDGGIGVRWGCDRLIAEIDVAPDGSVEAIIEHMNGTGGIEFPAGTQFAEFQQYYQSLY